MSRVIDKKTSTLLVLLTLGIMARYLVMTLGYNYDFESYCIVGEIAGSFRNVYAETHRYNYGPIFMCIQGTLYRLSQVRPDHWVQTYRVLMVSVLTLADIGIAVFIARRYSYAKSMAFFLNPISIIITGYHNQFDNIAIFFVLLATTFFNKEEQITKKDVAFVSLFTFSLLTKHITFLLPVFILFMKGLPIKKRCLYAFLPPTLFLASFLPFALSSEEAFQGILNNVFLYRSFNNMPLFHILFKLVNFPSGLKFILYVLLMITLAWNIRNYSFDNIVLIYLIAMVAFSSAIANQYLAIPMAALCILNVKPFDKIYMTFIGLYLCLEGNGLGALNAIRTALPHGVLSRCAELYVKGGYILAAWILLLSLFLLLARIKQGSKVVSEDKLQLGNA